MKSTYNCKKCGLQKLEASSITVKCPICGEIISKKMVGVSTDKEDDSITLVIEKMKYATNPSGGLKSVF